MSLFDNALCMVNPLCSVTQREPLVGNVANEIKEKLY